MNDLRAPLATAHKQRIGRNHRMLPELPAIPRARYIDEAFYQAELEHVFGRTWLQVAHKSEFEKEGSFRTFDLPNGPVIIVRGKDNVLRAFINSCQHRGATILHEKEGCTRVMACKYHSWSYDLTGKLIGLPARETFPNLKLEDYALKSVRCETWGGFVFVNFDKDAAPLAEWIKPMARRFQQQADAPLRIVSKQSWEINCNWKFLVEAFRESYHVPTVHPATVAQALEGYDTFYEMYPNGGGTVFIPYTATIMQAAFSGVPLNQTGLTKLPGMEDMTETTLLASFFPNAIIGFQPTGFPLIASWPISVDRSRIEIHWYGMDWGNGPMPEEWNKIVSDFTVVAGEDLAMLEGIQKAVKSNMDRGMPTSTLECMVYQLHSEIDKVIGTENVAPALRVPDVLGDYLSI